MQLKELCVWNVCGMNHNSNSEYRGLELVSEFTRFIPDKWGIPSPPASFVPTTEALSDGGIDLFVVPGLAFDKFGGRLGKGKGFYDRYFLLSDRQKASVKVALALDEQVVAEVPMGSSDVRVTHLITPTWSGPATQI
eukprot:c12031_g1_i2.p1 GENE.c12031_g1_i2~~c12031_g1_i2.p1  ORF type:complete len:137 (-),score=24.57 c12031_g1_i2:39-449(-)